MDGVWYLNTNRRLLFLGKSEAPAYVLTVFIYNAESVWASLCLSVSRSSIRTQMRAENITQKKKSLKMG